MVELLRPIRSIEDIREIESRPWHDLMPANTVYELIEKGAAKNPDADAMLFLPDMDARPITYSFAETVSQITQAANLFTSLGVEANDAISFLTPILPQAHIGLWAAETAGIANPINPLLGVDEISHIMRLIGTKVLVTIGGDLSTDLWQKACAVAAHVPSLTHIAVIGSMADGAPVTPIFFEREYAAQPKDRLLLKRQKSAQDVAAYFHTGGTTGSPKLVIHSHENQVFAAWASAQMYAVTDNDRMVNGLPLFHVAGSILTGLTPLACGCGIILPTAGGFRNPKAVEQHWTMVEQLRPTIIGGIPTTVNSLLNVPLNGADIGSIEICKTGGAPLTKAVGEAFQSKFGIPLHQIYGMTETAGMIGVTPRPVAPTYEGIGFPVPFVQVSRNDETGELQVAGPNLFKGYYKSETEGPIAPNVPFATGDLGRVDADGYIHITGRGKDTIIRSGHNIDPGQIEQAADAVDGIAMSAAVGMPDAYAGEVPVVFVTATGDSPDREKLLDEVRALIDEPQARPRELFVLPEIPLTPVGKIFKPALRERAIHEFFRMALGKYSDELGAQNYSIGVSTDDQGTFRTDITLVGADQQTADDLTKRLSEDLRGIEVTWALCRKGAQ